MDFPATSPAVDKEAFGKALLPSSPRHRAVKQLQELLDKLDATVPLESRVEQLEQLAKWLRSTGKVPAPAGADPADRPQVSRLRLLVIALAGFPQYRLAFSGVIRTLLGEATGLYLFAR